MLGERHNTKEFFRDPEFFLDELLLLDSLGEFELEAFLDDPRLFALDLILLSSASSGSSVERMMVGEVDLEVWSCLLFVVCWFKTYRLRKGLSSGSWRQFCRSSRA